MANQWTVATFGDLVTLSQGLCFNAKTNHLMSETGIPLLRIADLINNTQTKFVDAEKVPKKYIASPNDIIYTRTGQVGLVFKGKVGVVHNNCFRVIPNEQLKPDYVYWYLRQPSVIEKAKALAGGAAQPDLAHDAFKSITLTYPDLDTQEAIVNILSAYDELIENSQRRIKILEAMTRALYREWFVHFRFPGHESVSCVPSPLGEIPQGWEVKKLGDLCTLAKDTYRDASHSELPLLDLARMPSRTLAPQETGKPSELTTSRIVFQQGDTLFGAIRCYLHKVVAMHYSGVTNTSVLVLRPKIASFRSLLAVIASDADTIRWAETQSTGTKMPVINWGVFQMMPTPIPSQALAQEYERLAGPMLDEIGALATQIQNLRRTRDLLLPRLLSGQIDLEAMPS